MEEIDDFVDQGQQQFESIDDLISALPDQSFKPLPSSATTNQSAVLSVLSMDAENMINNFQSMQMEATMGMTSLADSIRQQAQERTRESAFKSGMLPLLSSPEFDLQAKQQALDSFNKSLANPDPLVILASESVIADSDGESVDAEEARISISDDLFGNFQESYKLEQAAVNNFKVELQRQATAAGTAADIAQEVFIPVAEGIKTFSFITELNDRLGKNTTFEKKTKALIRPGASIEEIRDQYFSLSDNDRMIFVQTVIDTIKDTQGVIFSSDSQFSALATLEKVIGDYSPAEATWDTMVNALDIFGVGWAARGATRAFRSSRNASEAVLDANQGVTPATVSNPTTSVLDVPRDIQTKVANPEKTKLDGLYEEKARLLGEASEVLPNRSVANLNKELEQVLQQIEGAKASFKTEVKNLQIRKQMSRKEAESAVNKALDDQLQTFNARKDRIEGLLEANRRGQKSQDQIKAIETEIDRIENLPDVDGVIRLNPLRDAMNRVERNSLIGVENPASIGSIFFKTNPTRSRSVMKAIYDSSTDEVATAIFGTSRTEALGMAFMPKQVTASGKISARPVDVMREVNTPSSNLMEEVKDVLSDKGASELTPREIELASDRIVNDFRSPTRIKAVDGMDGIQVDLDKEIVKISSVYGNARGSFSDAEDALTQAKLALRHYGDIVPFATIMKKDGVNYSPVKLEDVKGQKGDYLVKIEFDKPITRADLPKDTVLDEFKNRFNWSDSVPSFISEKAGNLTRHIFSVGSIFDKQLTTAANVADALTSRLEKILQSRMRDIVGNIKKLPKAHQDKLSSYFVEANEKGIALSLGDLAQRGFTAPMVQIAKDWREYWDSVFYLENLDTIKTLRNNGYQLLDNGSDRFFAKPIPKSIREAKGYDPESGTMVVMNREEMDKLYEQGGTIAQLKSSFTFEGEEVTNLIVKNNSNSYLRGLTDADRALNYREGYYLTSYRAPIFIDKVDPKTGKRVAVATALDSVEADLFKKRAEQENPGFKFVARPDKKKLPDQKQDVWDLNFNGGRTAQRRRGKPLVDADGSNRLEGSAYFETPIESAIRASRSIAGRTIYRDLIETMKARAMQKHGHLFPTSEGVTQFPSQISDIKGAEGNVYTKEVRDARTDFEYIHYLENGYMNGLDNMFKTVMGALANQTGQLAIKTGGITGKVLSKAERGLLYAQDTPVSGLGKAVVFNAYIATNVFRQWVVQPAQLFRLAAYDPIGVHQTLRYLSEYTSFMASGKGLTKNGNDFVDFVESSGILDSVDKSNIVRGTLMTSGEQASWWAKTGGRVTEPLRVVGYDLGEKTNLLGHMAAVFNKYQREGKNVNSLAVRREMLGKARAISYDMGFSGDMPYNQNFLAVFTQFMQVPHKALMQGLDRRLTPAERVRMVAGDMLLYGAMGTPIVMAANALFGEKFLDENPNVKEVIVEGAMQKGLNAFLQNSLESLGVEGPSRDLDISGSLSPFEFGGYAKMVEGLLTDGGFSEAISNTPIGGLLYRDGNRVQKAVLSVGRLMGYLPDSELTPQTISATLNDIASITSGWNNIQKAILAKEMNRISTKTGQTLIEGVNTADAIALALGIPPKDISQFYESVMYLSEESKAYEDSVRQAAKTAIEVATGRTKSSMADPATREIFNAIILKAYRSNPKALMYINDEVRRALQDPDSGLLKSALDNMAFPELQLDREKMKKMFTEDQWDKVDRWHNDINTSLEALKLEE